MRRTKSRHRPTIDHIASDSRRVVFDLDQCSFLFVSNFVEGHLREGTAVIHSMKGRSLADNLWAELGLLAAATVILLVLASGYVW